MRKITIIILTYNNLELTQKCLASIKKYTPKDLYELLVIDNNSTDETVAYLKNEPDIRSVFLPASIGFHKGCNLGLNLTTDTDILFLNNDTIVTPNWLENLQKCLYSNESIGAVGAVSNDNANLQGASFDVTNPLDIDELIIKNNQSDPQKWEEKVCLIGFCMLIKREVINRLSGFDEGYSPGYIEDNDLSLQILKLGYKLYLCHDAFIFHALGSSFRQDTEKFNNLILTNRQYFYQKWHFPVFAFDHFKNSSLFLAANPQKILDYHCEIGASTLKIKYLYPKACVIGVEKNRHQRVFASLFTKVYQDLKDLKDLTFDTIFIGDFLEQTANPLIFLHKLATYLKDGGYIIGEFHNLCSFRNYELFLKEEWYYTNFFQKHSYTKNDIMKMFTSLGFKNGTFYPFSHTLTPLEEGKSKALPFDSSIYYYAFRFQK